MLDLLAFMPIDDVGALVSAGTASLVRRLVGDASQGGSSSMLSANASFLLLGFLIGLAAEMRKSE